MTPRHRLNSRQGARTWVRAPRRPAYAIPRISRTVAALRRVHVEAPESCMLAWALIVLAVLVLAEAL